MMCRTFKDRRRSSKSLSINNKLIYLEQDSLNYLIHYWHLQYQEQKSHIVKIYAQMESTKYHHQVNITIRFRLHQPYPSPMRQLIGQQLRHTTLILHCPAQQQARLQEMLYLQRVYLQPMLIIQIQPPFRLDYTKFPKEFLIIKHGKIPLEIPAFVFLTIKFLQYVIPGIQRCTSKFTPITSRYFYGLLLSK